MEESGQGVAWPAAVVLAGASGHGGSQGVGKNGEDDERVRFPSSPWAAVAHRGRSTMAGGERRHRLLGGGAARLGIEMEVAVEVRSEVEIEEVALL
jgi:hypothetical protein